jgi:phenylpropionate dioxygenase-like ring-hydroxylating dioxygenase large terminal subunit
MPAFADDAAVLQRIFDHIDNRSTDRAAGTWREPVASYTDPVRFAAELALMRRTPVPFCPSAALPQTGSWLARLAGGTPLLAVRDADGQVRVFRNACRHRGALLADGTGCDRAFVCRYHGWTYGTDGVLRHIPHADGFPGLDPATHGLVPVAAAECRGMVIVAQDAKLPADGGATALPDLVGPQYRLHAYTDVPVEANWKVLAEGFLEGYHIRSTHRDTFYPRQYDNLNVVELDGCNSRIAYPYRSIEKQRALPPAERRAGLALTYVYHLFPNVMLATFPTNLVLVAIEPVAIDRSRLVSWTLTDRPADQTGQGEVDHARDFVTAGAAEDRAVVAAIQQGIASGANEYFEYGLFEGAIANFHRALHRALD